MSQLFSICIIEAIVSFCSCFVNNSVLFDPYLDHYCGIFPQLSNYQLITMKTPLRLQFCSDGFHFFKWSGPFSELPVPHLFLPSVFVCSEVKESANLWRASSTGGVVKPDLLCRSQWQASRHLQVRSAVPGGHARDTAGWYHAVHNSQRDEAGEIGAAGPAAAQVSVGWAACHRGVGHHCHLFLETKSKTRGLSCAEHCETWSKSLISIWRAYRQSYCYSGEAVATIL